MTTKIDWGRITGETPIEDAQGLLDKTITTRGRLNQVEAEGIAIVASKYLAGRPSKSEAPFSYDWLFSLHGEMFGGVWDWAGTPRKRDLTLGCPFYEVEPRVLELVKSIPYWKDYSLIEQAVRIHHRAVNIHPFLNGNGRWSRMLGNIWLKRHRQKVVLWPEPEMGIVCPVRDEYIAAIQAADAMQYGPLIEMHHRFAI